MTCVAMSKGAYGSVTVYLLMANLAASSTNNMHGGVNKDGIGRRTWDPKQWIGQFIGGMVCR
jgi:hypothetical protein